MAAESRAGSDPGAGRTATGAALGIVAGRGTLPAQLVETCRAQGRGVFVVALEGQTDPATVEGVDHVWVRLGDASKAIEPLRAAGVEELVLAGGIVRPSLAELRPNLRVASFLARVGKRAFGDDGLLRAIIGALEEEEGFRVVGIDDLLGELVAEAGIYGRHGPDRQAEADIERGREVARAIGAMDVGQSAVVQQGLVLGVEAVEGTDALLARCAGLRRDGPGGVLVKIKKPGQERRADLPTIGVQTVRAAAAAGLRGIAVEAGGALVVDRAGVVREADAAGLFVIGIEPAP
jgi:DUF1009 family protein